MSETRERDASKDEGPDYWPFDPRLETWENPSYRSSTKTVDDLAAACIAAHRLQIARRQERERETLVSGLNAYAKQNNMQPDELEFVEVKERAQVIHLHEAREYLHFNFVVKQMDGTTKLFFAEINPCCRGDKDVYLCTPLEDDDCGLCFGCIEDKKDLKHPTSRAYLAGRDDIYSNCHPYVEYM